MNKFLILSVSVAAACAAFARIELGAPFTNGAILQRGMKVPVWGDCGPCKIKRDVTVSFAGQKKTAVVDASSGRWRVDLDPMDASVEPRAMTVVVRTHDGFFWGASKETVEVKDVLVGEVWFASGQSNMECPIWGANTRYRDLKGGFMTQMTRLPLVRYAQMERTWSTTPFARKATWCAFTPEGLLPAANGSPNYLSAVAFYYARELYLALGIPVGVLDASWGGTNIDAWTPRCGYAGCDPSLQATADYAVKAKDDWKAETDKTGPISGPHQQPTVLFNGMVAAYAPMAMRGFIWYQGCHNNGEAQLYAAKMHALYNGWARAFENKDLKLYFVELAPWTFNWPDLCAAQEKFVAEEPHAALAVTSDVGNFDDIHPNDKEIVAKRLALHALKRDYGFAIPEENAPVFTGATYADGKATLSFANVKDWYVYAPNRSREAAFEVAGADGVWQPAKIVNYRQAKNNKGMMEDTDYIDGSTIVVASDKVTAPVRVRYMVKNRTSGTLYNEASLPLGVFQAK